MTLGIQSTPGVRRGRSVQRSVSNVSNLTTKTPRPVCGVRAVTMTGGYRDHHHHHQHHNKHLSLQQQQQGKPLQPSTASSVNRSFSNVSDMSRTYQR